MTSASTEEDTAFDPFAYPEEVPIDELAELRSECPVARTPTGWYLTKFDHVLAATKDVETFVSSFRDPGVVVPEEESLRIDSPAHMLIRDCTADTDVFGAPMSRGDKIVFGVSSANRDEDYFDDPDDFRLNRERPKDHIAFGGGPHICPGASLARLEGRVALEVFLERVATAELAPGSVRKKTPVFWANGPDRLEAFLTPEPVG